MKLTTTGLTVLVIGDGTRKKAERWTGRASVRGPDGQSVEMVPVIGPTRKLVWTECLGFIERTLAKLDEVKASLEGRS